MPGLPLFRAEGWFTWTPLARYDPNPGEGPGGSDPLIGIAAAAAKLSGRVLWGIPLRVIDRGPPGG